MSKQKNERLLMTLFVILFFILGFFIGINDSKIKLCEKNNTFYGTVNNKQGCIKYLGEYCLDNNNDIREKVFTDYFITQFNKTN